ncbi:hypothetical protein [Microbulbifer sp. ANSA005]|uniref:hypothetical protein n=1 Tax=Microbulbifer sp. ANSA005 TaxID=3243362 RepID=UPI004040FD1A
MKNLIFSAMLAISFPISVYGDCSGVWNISGNVYVEGVEFQKKEHAGEMFCYVEFYYDSGDYLPDNYILEECHIGETVLDWRGEAMALITLIMISKEPDTKRDYGIRRKQAYTYHDCIN